MASVPWHCDGTAVAVAPSSTEKETFEVVEVAEPPLGSRRSAHAFSSAAGEGIRDRLGHTFLVVKLGWDLGFQSLPAV
jgi:hypothetical protein